MKTRKILTSLAAVALAAVFLTACGSDNQKETTESSTGASSQTVERVAGGELQDGTYQLEELNESNGYRVVFSMTVEDGKITSSNYDQINEAGDSKADDETYEKNMRENSPVGPKEFIAQLNESFVSAQTAEGVEVVTGATLASTSFQNYAQQLIQAAQAGNTDTIEINNGADLQDGTYTLTEKNESREYLNTFSIVVKDGKITESNFDSVNSAGESKKDDADYNEMMKEQAGVSPAEYIDQLNDNLVEVQAPKDVEVVTGATHSSHTFILYAQQLINAAEKGDTTEIVVDNIVTK